METSRAPAVGESVCGYKLLRKLGLRAAPSFVAADPMKRSPGGVVQVDVFDEDVSTIGSDARALAQLVHPKIARVRDVVTADGRVVVVSDLVDGASLADLLAGGMPLGAVLRVLLDVLDGLGALHGLRAASPKPQAMQVEVAPIHVMVGLDGVARLANLVRSPAENPGAAVIGYLAPEILLHDESADAHAEVYSVGVLLWEALAGRRMHEALDPDQIVLRLLSGKIERPGPPRGAPWGEPLADVAKRAIAPEVALRYGSAAEMSEAVRRLAGGHCWDRPALAAFVQERAGLKDRARAGLPPGPPRRPQPVHEAPPLPARAAAPAPPPSPAPAERASHPRLSVPTPIVPFATISAALEMAQKPEVELPVDIGDLETPPPPEPIASPPPPAPPPPSLASPDAPLAVTSPSHSLRLLRSPGRRMPVVLAGVGVALLLVYVAVARFAAVPPASSARESPPATPTVSPDPSTAANAPAVAVEPSASAHAENAPAPVDSSRPPTAARGNVAPPGPGPAAPTESVAPPPLKKKAKTTYYPLGI